MTGARIALLRKEQGLSQQELAKKLGCSASAVGMYEQGRREPPFETLIKMAELFGVSTDYLLTGKESQVGELAAMARLFETLRGELSGELILRSADGRETPLDEKHLALLFAALFG